MTLFELIGKIIVKNQEANNNINDTTDKASKASEKISSAFKTVGKVVTAGVAAGATAVTALATKSIQAYADYEQLVSGAELLFGDAYSYITDKAKNAYATVQMSQNDYLQQVNGFATGLKTALGGNEQAAAELADRIITAEADIVAATGNTQENVQNAFNGIMKSNFTMLDNLQLGITPTKEGFQEVIDKVNEWNKANGNATKYQISNLADCQSALLDYIKMQGLSGYAMDEASKTITGSISMMKASWSNLVTAMASDEMDFGFYVQSFVDSVEVMARNILPRVEDALKGVGQLVEQLAPVIVSKLPELVENVLPSILEATVSLLSSLAQALPGLADVLIKQIPVLVGLIRQELEEQFPQLEAPFKFIEDIFSGVWQSMQTIWAEIGVPIFEALSTAFENAKDAVQPLIDKFSEYVTSGEVTEDITSAVETAVEGLITAYESAVGFIGDVVTGFQDAVTWAQEHETTLSLVAVAVGTLTAAIVAYNIAQAIKNAGGIVELAQLAALAIGLGALTVAETAHTVATTIATAATSAFGAVLAFITSPITLVVLAIGALIAIGVALYQNWDVIKEKCSQLGAFLSEKWNSMKEAVSSKASEMMASAKAKFEEIRSAASEKFNSMKESVSSAVSNAKEKAVNAFNNIKSSITDAVSNALSAVKGKFDSIKQTISDKLSSAWDTVQGIVKKIKSAFDFSIKFDLKLPHVTLTGGKAPYGIGGKGSLPKFDVKWFKKAYDEAMILTDPTIFGYSAASGKMLGGGEGNGNEVVAGEEHLLKLIGSVVENKTAEQNEKIIALLTALLNAITGGNEELLRAFMSDRTFAVGEREFARLVKQYA